MLRRHFNADLAAFSSVHLHYDVQMLFELAHTHLLLNQNGNFLKSLSCIEQGLKEAVALHVRNLAVFFYNDSPGPSEFTAADYCAEEKWLEERLPMTRTLCIAQKWADKMLLPLTLERNSLEESDMVWDLEGLMSEIRLVLHVFLKTAKSECLAPAFAQKTGKIFYQEELRQVPGGDRVTSSTY
jgi:hypothetical protein